VLPDAHEPKLGHSCLRSRMHGARGGAPEGERNSNYRHGARSKENMTLWKLIKSMK
jgi:hypothetical protein